ncbi:hypothetical protein ACOMHN_017836 [Nucella lapillus]
MDMLAAQQRTMKEFLELYNKIVDQCFGRCVSNFNQAKASGDELHCIDTCVDKSINFNQRHMMVFVEHQNNKQKLAAKIAAEAQSSAPSALPNKGEATPQMLSTSPEQGPSPVDQPAMSVEKTSAETVVPQNVCYKLDSRLCAQFVAIEPEKLTAYSGKLFEEYNISPQAFFTVDDDVVTAKPYSPRKEAASTAATPADSTNSYSDDDSGEPQKPVSKKKLLDSMNCLNALCMQNDVGDEIMKQVRMMTFSLQKHVARLGTQKTTPQFFKETPGTSKGRFEEHDQENRQWEEGGDGVSGQSEEGDGGNVQSEEGDGVSGQSEEGDGGSVQSEHDAGGSVQSEHDDGVSVQSEHDDGGSVQSEHDDGGSGHWKEGDVGSGEWVKGHGGGVENGRRVME